MVPQVFVRLEEMPLTEHGKVDRKALPAPGRLERVSGEEYVAPRTDEERILAAIWREVLKLDQVGVDDDFFSLGGDSILSIQVISRARRAGMKVSPKQLFSNPTVAGLAAVAVRIGAAGAEHPEAGAEGPVPLTPIQQWFFEQRFADVNHYNQAFVIHPAQPLDLEALRRSLAAVARHHDAFRLRYARGDDGGWEQGYREDAAAVPVTLRELEPVGAGEGAAFEQACREMQESLDIESGPVAAACVIRGPGERERLLLVIHHLVVDGVSWRILLEDLDLAYGQTAAGGEARLPYRSASFKAWGQRLGEYARSAAAAAQWPYWLGVGSISGAGGEVPVEFDEGEPRFGESVTSRVVMDRTATRDLLTLTPRVYGAGVEDVLLAALLLSFHKLWGSRGLLLHLEGHGREDLGDGTDLTRTVGWFTSLYPVYLELPEAAAPEEVVRSVRERLRAVPDRGLGYGVLRYLSGDARAGELTQRDTAAVSFNYLGRMEGDAGAGALPRSGIEPAPGMTAPGNRNPHLVDCWGMVTGGELRVDFVLSGRHFSPETAGRLSSLYRDELAGMLAHLRAAEDGGYASSGFAAAGITPGKLRELERRWGSGAIESVYGLAPLQAGLLFHSCYAPRSDQYVEQLIWSYEGKLDRDALKGAWEEIVQRHAVLRTAFVWDELEEPVQVVLSRVELGWHEEDLRGFDPPSVRAGWRST